MWPLPRSLSKVIGLALAVAALLLQARVWLAPARGLQAEYFVGERPIGVPDIAEVDDSVSTRQVALRWSGAAPETFNVRWFGFLTISRPGSYTFTLTADDGAAMSIDGRLLVDNGGRHGPVVQQGMTELSAGTHPVLIEFIQAGGAFTIDWQWAQEGRRPSTVPAWALTPYKVAPWRVMAWRACDLLSLFSALMAMLGLAWGVWLARLTTTWTPLRHPRLAALVLFFMLACVHTWPLITDPGHLARHDNRDTILNEWIVAWVAHQGVHAPLELFDGNIFYPEKLTLAYSEPMIVQSAMGAPMLWLGASPVLTYSLLLILGFSLSGWSMCLVVRRWTDDWVAGIISGCVFAFCAHTLTRIPHLQAQHVEFLPMALLALDTLLRQPSAGRGAKLAIWCVLQGLTSIYLLAITMFAMGAALLARQSEWAGLWSKRRVRPALRALGVTALVAAVLLLPLLLPYYRVSHTQGLSRSLGDAANNAAAWNDYLTTPARIHSATWSAQFAGNTGLFPGALGLLLSLVAVARGVAFTDPRARMCLAIGVAGVYLSFGPTLPGYAVLYKALPLLQGIRATARFGYMATIAVAVLAGFGTVSLRSLLPARRWPAVAALLLTVAAVEPLAAPLGLTRFDGIAPIYDRLSHTPGTVVVEFPFFGPRSAQFHANYMLNSTRNWRPLVNGYSGFQPASFYRHAEALEGFPDDASMAMLRELHATHVFVHRNQLPQDRLKALQARPEFERLDGFGETELYALK